MPVIVAIVSPKGGAGKTTLTAGLAGAAAICGKSCTIIDLDPQASITNWSDRRDEADDKISVVSCQVGRMKKAIEAAAEADLIVIDTAGRNDNSALESARIADICLTPIRMVVSELETLSAVRDILATAGKSDAGFVVINGVHTGVGDKAIADMRKLIETDFSMPVLPCVITHRQDHPTAFNCGKTIFETSEIMGKAGAEMSEIYSFLGVE